MAKQNWIFTLFMVTLVIGLAQKHVLLADPGDLDVNFGNNGVVTTDIGGFDTAIDVTTQTDGKIVVSGSTFGSPTNFALVRYGIDGTLDTTFGSGGVVTTTISASDIGREIVLQSDGKLVVGGSTEVNGNKDFAVARYNSNGDLDTGFDGDGIVVTPISAGSDEVWGIILQGDGKIVAVGESNGQFTVVRYNNNGSLDTSFGTNGIAMPISGTGQAVKIQPDSKIVIAGRSGGEFTVVRLNNNGSLDSSFDTDGIVSTFMGNGAFVSAWDLSLQADGKIVVTGASFNGSDYDLAVVRYTDNGALDSSFDTDGTTFYDSGFGNDEGLALAIQANGKIVASGYSNSGSGEVFTLIQLNPNGTFDTSFNGSGIVTNESGQRSLGITIQADNMIILTGYHSGNYVTVRYEGDPMSDNNKFVYLPSIHKP